VPDPPAFAAGRSRFSQAMPNLWSTEPRIVLDIDAPDVLYFYLIEEQS
jgi:hypothetical protein